MLRYCQCYLWTVEIRYKLLAQQKRNNVPLFWYATLVLSACSSQQISVHGVARMAPVCRADSLVDGYIYICIYRPGWSSGYTLGCLCKGSGIQFPGRPNIFKL